MPYETVDLDKPLANLHDPATELLETLLNLRKIDPHRPIVFIAHSVGGLVAKLALVRAWKESKYRAIARATRAIIFLGTPHRITSLFKPALPLVNCIGGESELRPSRNDYHLSPESTQSTQSSSTLSFSLEELHKSWVRTYATRLRITSLYETVSPLVSHYCAVCDTPGETVLSLNTTHELLGYAQSRNDLSYRTIRDVLSWMLDWIHESVPSRRDFGQDEDQILRSLWPNGLVSSLNTIPNPHEGTLSWLWPNPSLQTWLESQGPSIYWIVGKAGSGKSTIMKYLLDKLTEPVHDATLSTQGSEVLPMLVAAHFTDFNFPPSSSESILRSLLHQVIALQPSLSKFLPPSLTTWRYHDESHLRDLSFALHHLARHSNIIVIVDALDECHASVQRDTLGALYLNDTQVSPEDLVPPETRDFCASFCMDSGRGLRVMMSSRQQMHLGIYLGDPLFRLDLSSGQFAQGLINDAQNIVEDRLQLRWDLYRGVLTPIFDQLVKTDDTTGIYLWVDLVTSLRRLCTNDLWSYSLPGVASSSDKSLTALLPSHATCHDPTTYLSVVPTKFDDLYQFALEAVLRKGSKDSKLDAIKALTWVCVAQAPLSPDALWDAVGVKYSDSRQSRDSLRARGTEARVPMLGGLVEIRNSSVQFIHQTVKEFLIGKLPMLWPGEPTSLQLSLSSSALMHEHIKLSCVSYLETVCYEEHRSLNTEDEDLEQRWPLLGYAATNWRRHQVLALNGATDELTRKLLRPGSMVFLAWFRRWWDHECHNEQDLEIFPANPTQGIAASFMGHEALILEWLQLHSMRATERTTRGVIWTPLMAAAWSGHIDVVHLLLNQPETEHEHPEIKANALVHAIKRGHRTCVQSLAMSFAVPTAGPSSLRDVYLAAAQEFGYGLVAQLLDKGANPDIDGNASNLSQQLRDKSLNPDENSRLLLQEAVRVGSINLIALLVQKGGLRDGRRTNHYPTALHTAAVKGVPSIAKYLLELGHSDLSARDYDGKTPLHHAITGRRLNMVKFLLDHGANIDVADNLGNTALDIASRNGDAGVVELLLGRARSFVNMSPQIAYPTNFTLTNAFFNACQSGSYATVRLLLRMNIPADLKRDGIPALHQALTDGLSPATTGMEKPPHEISRIRVLRLLLDAGVSPDVTDSKLQTCLHRAARRSESRVIRYLLSRGADVSLCDQHGRTPLDYASQNADLEAMKSLLDFGSIVSNTTWLSALESGNSPVVIYLLGTIRESDSPQDTAQDRASIHFDLQPHPTQVLQYFLQNNRVPDRFSSAMRYLRGLRVSNPQHIHVEKACPSSRWDTFTRKWESMTGSRWIWWPLPTPSPIVQSNDRYVYWCCPGGGGLEHYEVVSRRLGAEIQSVINFQKEISATWRKTEANTDILDTQASPSGTSFTASSSSSAPLLLSSSTESISTGSVGPDHYETGSYEMGDFPAQVDRQFQNNTSSTMHHGSNPPDNQDPGRPDPSDPNPDSPRQVGEWVVVKPGKFPIEQIKIETSSSHKEFFENLTESYRRRRLMLKRLLSIYRFSHWGFDMVTHPPFR
ncbi:hypothetical protein PG985_004410 [Apiospora marii]|uniref:uncharacterized protein n=1 Tax=Apiospora marii TaxID=335849 RepID=UPI00313191EA